MTPLRVLIAGLPRPLLRELIILAAASRSGLAVLTSDDRPERLPESAAEAEADVVIFELAESDLPAPFRQLFVRCPAVTAVSLLGDGRRAVVCLPDVGIEQLLDTIRAAARPPRT